MSAEFKKSLWVQKEYGFLLIHHGFNHSRGEYIFECRADGFRGATVLHPQEWGWEFLDWWDE